MLLLLGHFVLSIPALAFGYVTWRLIRRKERIASVIIGLLALACVALHPSIQMLADKFIAYPYAKKKEALAIEYDIVGKNYAEVVKILGQPNRSRVESPTIGEIATKRITKKLDTYQALDYYVSPTIYIATRFIVFLDEEGNVTSHRVKWEYGQGR